MNIEDSHSQITGSSVMGSALVLTILGYLPTILAVIASLLGVIWFLICIFESRSYTHWSRNRNMKRNARRLMKLRAREKVVIAKIEAAETLRQARVAARELVDRQIAEAEKLVAQNNIVTRADVIVQTEADREPRDKL
jgi:uncharacterized membrane protein